MRRYTSHPAMLLAACAIGAACANSAPQSGAYAVEVVACDARGECDANRPDVFLSLADCMAAAPDYWDGADTVACVNLNYRAE